LRYNVTDIYEGAMANKRRELSPEEEAYLRSIAAAADQVRDVHNDLQKGVRNGPLQMILDSGQELKQAVDKLLRAADVEPWRSNRP